MKAFDTVNHDILISKLHSIGLNDKLLELFRSYLSKRELQVYYKRAKSRVFLPPSGIHQGSNLGALLFLIYVNDISKVLNIDSIMYADHLKIYRHVETACDIEYIQGQINNLSNWCKINKLQVNVTKCAVVSYTRFQQPLVGAYVINGQLIPRSSCVRDLGLHFNSVLNFSQHINNICLKAYKSLGYLMRSLKDINNIQVQKAVYFSIVRSKLEYASIVWAPHEKGLCKQLEAVQRRFLKYLYLNTHGVYPARGTSQERLREEFGVAPLSNRRMFNDISFISKVVAGRIGSPQLLERLNFFVPRINSRALATFYVSKSKRN